MCETEIGCIKHQETSVVRRCELAGDVSDRNGEIGEFTTDDDSAWIFEDGLQAVGNREMKSAEVTWLCCSWFAAVDLNNWGDGERAPRRSEVETNRSCLGGHIRVSVEGRDHVVKNDTTEAGNR